MKIIKRDGSEVDYDEKKIINAITKANNDVKSYDKISTSDIIKITENITNIIISWNRTPSVEEIQDLVEEELIKLNKYKLAKSYIIYRYEHQISREGNSTDAAILSLVGGTNELIMQENSNKNPTIAPTQRDYIAGEVSKDISKRLLLPKRIIEAHENGEIHFHDMDYFIQRIYNCCLCNLEDMLDNSTIVNGTLIESPNAFSTACTIGTQIIAQVSSNQYGGQTISLYHLSKYINATRNKLKKFHSKRRHKFTDEEWDEFIEDEVKKDIKDGIQTIQYQINTLMTTNGQAPFVSLYMDLNEAPEGRERDDLALAIEEVLTQRIQGIKNEKGIWITPAFPKLLYVTDEFNIRKESKYFYLTELAAKCMAKRMVPDIISAKKMREYKNGDVYPCMGCRSFLTPDRFHKNLSNDLSYKEGKNKYYGRFNQGKKLI